MANVLTVPNSGIISFDPRAYSSLSVPDLSASARIGYDTGGGVNITSYTTSPTALNRFSVDGTQGRLFTVTDALTGSLFSVNNITGLPILEVKDVNTVVAGKYNSNALVVSGAQVSVGNTPFNTAKLGVSGDVTVTGPLTLGSTTALVSTTPNVIQQTWGNTNAAFTLISANVTDLSSNASSLLMDLQVGGTGKVGFQKNGMLVQRDTSGNRLGFYANGNCHYWLGSDSVTDITMGFDAGSQRLWLASGGLLGWNAYIRGQNNTANTIDLSLYRDAAQTLAQRNGTNSQEFRLYNTWTTGTPISSEYLSLKANTGSSFTIGPSATGSGGFRDLGFQAGGSTRMTLTSAGNVGIGTTAPTYPLEIKASNAFVNCNTTGSFAGIRFQINGIDRYTAALNGSGDQIYSRFNSSGGYLNDVLSLKSTGDVVVNTNQLYVQYSNGSVGIGTTTPNERLTVSGNISATGYVSANAATITGNLATGSNYVVTLALTANQTVAQGADAVIVFDPKNDPNNWFSRTAGTGLTARRITPTVPGYYYINYQLHWQPGLSGINNQNNIQIMKSNAGASAITININQQPIDSSSVSTCQMGNAISYFNGSTDYVYFQAYTANTTSQTVVGESGGTWTKVEMFKIN